ncbi:MAG: hypothetical protein RL386_1025 [Bacteroidota bacterium]|jgi:hypothetical protein
MRFSWGKKALFAHTMPFFGQVAGLCSLKKSSGGQKTAHFTTTITHRNKSNDGFKYNAVYWKIAIYPSVVG